MTPVTWGLFLILFAIGTSLPIESTLEEQVAKFTEGLLRGFPDFQSAEVGNAIPYDTMFSSWQSGAPDFHMLAELPPRVKIPHVQVTCNKTHLTVRVAKRFNGVVLRGDEWLLGSCYSNGDDGHHLVFTYPHSQCGTDHVITNGQQLFSNLLHFNPRDTFFTWWLIPFTMPFSCVPERSEVRPRPLNVLKSPPPPEKDWGFALKAMHPSWTHPAESNVYHRGQLMHLQATARPGPDQHLSIQSCFVSSSPDPMARPRHGVIVNKGCTAWGPDHTAARFVAFRREDAVNFILNTSRLNPVVYLHCGVMVSDQGVTPDSKSCNYNKQKRRWQELSGDADVCSCCGSKCKGLSNRNPHIVSKAVVSTGPLIVTNRRPTATSKASVHESDNSSPPVASPVQSDTSSPTAVSGYRPSSTPQPGSAGPGGPPGRVALGAAPGGYLEGNVVPEAPLSSPGLVASVPPSSGSYLEGHVVPEALWSSPPEMMFSPPEVMFISQDHAGGTLTVWLPGQPQVNADVSLGSSLSPDSSMQSDAPAESARGSASLNIASEENRSTQQAPLAATQKETSPTESLTGQGLKSAESDTSVQGMDVIIGEWAMPLDLETASLIESPHRRQWDGRSNVPRMSIPSYKAAVEGYQPLPVDYMLNGPHDHLYDTKMGDGVAVRKTEESKVEAGSAGSSSSVFRSKLQVSQSSDGSQILSYEEEVKSPGQREKEIRRFAVEGKVQDERLGIGQSDLVSSFLDMLRRLYKEK